jgi:serine/threonine protein kinase
MTQMSEQQRLPESTVPQLPAGGPLPTETALPKEGSTHPEPGIGRPRSPVSGYQFPFLSRPDPNAGGLGQLGPFQVVELLGEGGMGFVFRAEDEALRRAVALKVMRPEVAAKPTAKERFLREGRTAAAVKSDHVVTIHQVGEANGVPFLAMELLDGVSLEDWLLTHPGPAPAEMTSVVARDVLKGLAEAHGKGLVHRDIKPANLWVEKGTGRIKVLDFGLTRPAAGDVGLTGAGQILGSPAYMAPEQAAGEKLDARADLFSLGVVLYRMAFGANPFQRETVYATMAALSTVVPPSAVRANALPEDLARLIDRLMARDPGGRPKDARIALEEWQAGGGITTPRKPRRGIRWAMAIALLAIVIVLTARGLKHPGPIKPRTDEDGKVTVEGSGQVPEPQGDRPTDLSDPVRITGFDIIHYARVEGGMVARRGVFGRDTFSAIQNDLVTLRVTLSRPAYAYLIAFRPDGVAEVCYPENDEEIPPLAAEASYPSKPTSATSAYGLSERPGLWVFAAIVSEDPLRNFKAWSKWVKIPSFKDPVGILGAVVLSDGDDFQRLSPAGLLNGTRGKGELVPGQQQMEQVSEFLRTVLPRAKFRIVGIVASPAR